MKQTQYSRLERLLTRARGVTAMEIIAKCGTVCPHKRISDLKERGWRITRRELPGKNYGAYFGQPPARA